MTCQPPLGWYTMNTVNRVSGASHRLAGDGSREVMRRGHEQEGPASRRHIDPSSRQPVVEMKLINSPWEVGTGIIVLRVAAAGCLQRVGSSHSSQLAAELGRGGTPKSTSLT